MPCSGAGRQRRRRRSSFTLRLDTVCLLPCPPTPQVEAFLFGSVPLRTYLPDGDIDISVFTRNPDAAGADGLRETWAGELLRALEREQSRPDAPLRVRDVQLIQAEVGAPGGARVQAGGRAGRR